MPVMIYLGFTCLKILLQYYSFLGSVYCISSRHCYRLCMALFKSKLLPTVTSTALSDHFLLLAENNKWSIAEQVSGVQLKVAMM